MKQLLLPWLLSFCVFLPTNLYSQVCPNPLPTGYNDAPPGCTICNFPFSGSNYGYTASGTLADGDYGCGFLALDNEQYFIFIANDECVSFTIDAYNCTAAGSPSPLVGLQAFIFDFDLTTTFACTQGCCGGPGTPPGSCGTDNPAFSVSTCELTVGTAYYLIIDGCAGSECDYEVTSTGTQGGDFVSISPTGPFCTDEGMVTLEGHPATGSTGTGVWIGDVNANGEFDATALGAGNYSATYTFTNIYGCEKEKTLNFVIGEPVIPTLDEVGTVCINDFPFALSATPLGGTWGAAGTDGTFNPASEGFGTHSVTYTFVSGGCVNSDEIFITVVPETTVNIEPLSGFICAQDPPFDLIADPTGGNWLGNVNANGTIDPLALGAGSFSATYIYTDENNCTSSDIINFNILPAPTVEILPQAPLCENDAMTALTAIPNGGTWGGDANGNGEIDPAILGAGNFTAYYTFNDSNDCTATDSLQFTIFPQTIPTFNNTGPWCIGAGIQTIEANPSGGLWGGVANTLGEVAPQNLGAGLHEVTYQFTDSNGCMTDSTFSIEVSSETITLQIDSLPPLCSDGNIEQLTAEPSGGVWGGAANESGEVNPMALGVGLHTVTYEVTDAEGCVFNGEQNIEVLAPVGIDFLSTDPFCLEDVTTIVEANPEGGVWSGDVNEFGEFNPSILGSGVHDAIYNYTDFAGCVTTTSFNFTIAEPLEIAFGDSVFCQSETETITLSASPANGTWTGDIVSPTGEINPSMLDLGEYTVTYTVPQLSENCIISQDFNISIIGIADLAILGDTNLCETSGSQTFTGTPSGGTWGGVADALGNVDVSTLLVGTHEVLYTATSDEGCMATISQEITVVAAPTASLSGNPTMCEGGETNLEILLTGIAPWIVTYTLEGGAETPLTIDSSPYEWAVNQGGEYVLVSVEDVNACANTATGIAMVTELASLQITNISSDCNGTNTGFIVQFEITGGDPASYSVSGIEGNLSSDAPYIFTSEDIPTGETANFTVSDDSPCEDVSDAATVLDCDCETDAGSLGEAAFEVCVTETVTVSHNADEFLDDNDALMYVLYAGTPNNVETVLVMAEDGTFGFDETVMEVGVTYYIAAIAGNGDPIEGMDLADSCLDYSLGMPVFFNALPTAVISPNQTICDGGEASLIFDLEGEAPFTVTLNDGTVLTDIPDGFEYVFIPSADTTIAVEMVMGQNCENTASSQATIEVNLPPMSELTAEVSICNTDQNNDPTTLNLNDLILSGDATGTWSDVDASGAIGTLPNLDFNGVATGDYTFEYTTATAEAPCENVSYTVTITVLDCSCPDVSIAPAGPFLQRCRHLGFGNHYHNN